MVNPEGVTRAMWNMFTHVQSLWNGVTVWEKRQRNGSVQMKNRVLIRLRWPEVVKIISKDVSCFLLGLDVANILSVMLNDTWHSGVVYVFSSNFHCAITFRTFLSVPHDSFTDTSWTFALAHMTSDRKKRVTMLPNWCRRVISRHSDGAVILDIQLHLLLPKFHLYPVQVWQKKLLFLLWILGFNTKFHFLLLRKLSLLLLQLLKQVDPLLSPRV